MIETFIKSFVTLFVTADPIGIVPIFIIFAGNLTAAERGEVALRAVVVAGGILVAFALFGDAIISFFGITIPAFEVAGGLLLFVIGFEMVFGKGDSAPRSPGAQPTDTSPVTQIAVFPLAIPMISGPGAISATILLSTHGDAAWTTQIELIVAIIGLMALTYGAMRLAGSINKLLGDIGRIVVSRLLGVILAALAMQYLGDGISTFASQIAKSMAQTVR